MDVRRSTGQSGDRDRVIEMTDIVDVVGDHIALRQKGREFACLCPFHDDKNPSMYVVPHKQIFHCFVCGAGGNVLDFVMRYHGMSFIEALKFLADRAGIELTSRSSRPKQADAAPGTDRDALAGACRAAQGFFQSIYKHPEHGAAARNAVESRGIAPEMVETFGIGAAPDRWDGLLATIRSKGMGAEAFLGAGLVKSREAGPGEYDTFRNRLMFPIFDQLNRPVAFGGRIINPDDTPKYVNSPESVLFDKGSTLFGLPQAMGGIKQGRTVIVTEGYTDVIACHQAGVTNVVATLGTALTEKHARVLRRLCDSVVLLFDGDEAGMRAADRAFEVFFAETVDVRVATLPGGQDPDELLRQPEGRAHFDAAIADAADAMAFRMDRLSGQLSSRSGNVESSARIRLVEDELTRLVDLGLHDLPPLRKQAFVRRLSRVSGLGEQAILASMPKRRRRRAAATGDGEAVDVGAVSSMEASGRMAAVDHLLGCLLHAPKLVEENSNHVRDILTDDAYCSGLRGRLMEAMSGLLASGSSVGLSSVLGVVEDQGIRALATSLALRVETITDGDEERLAAHCAACVGACTGSGRVPDRAPDGDGNDASASWRDSLIEGLAQRQAEHRERRTANRPVLPRVKEIG